MAKVNGPFAVSVRLSPPLSCSTTVPDNPDTAPTGGRCTRITATLVTLADPIVPDPLATEHV